MKTVRRIAVVGLAVASDMLGVNLSMLIYTPLANVVMHAMAGPRAARPQTVALENH